MLYRRVVDEERRATFARRLAAFGIDNVLYVGCAGLLLALSSRIAEGLADVVYFAAIVGQLVYFTAFEGSGSGQTPGKRVLRIRVADSATGEPIGFVRALYRTLGKNLSALPFALGFLWALWDRERQAWHDKLCGSIVLAGAAAREAGRT